MVSLVPPGSGLEQAEDRDPTPVIPAGTAAAECPEEEEPPAWEAPTAQISQRAPSPQAADDSLCSVSRSFFDACPRSTREFPPLLRPSLPPGAS